jgi:hypothetical protein
MLNRERIKLSKKAISEDKEDFDDFIKVIHIF